MKTLLPNQRQSGFFDLGIGLVLMAVFGATAAGIKTESEQQPAQESVSYAERVQD